MPILTVIAGPNGSGKSTLSRELSFTGRENLLDPDAVARRMNQNDLRSVAMAAGREVLHDIKRFLDEFASFAVETTLASKGTLQTMREAKLRGFHVDLIYICLNTSERGILRVQERVRQGGHDVPDEDIRRRYRRSLENLPEAIRIADRAILFDNSRYRRRRMMETRKGLIVWTAVNHPVWIAAVKAALHSENQSDGCP